MLTRLSSAGVDPAPRHYGVRGLLLVLSECDMTRNRVRRFAGERNYIESRYEGQWRLTP